MGGNRRRAGLDVYSEFRRRVAARLGEVETRAIPGTNDGRIVALEISGSRPLLSALEDDRHFCRDTRYGRTLHPGRPSFREVDRKPGLHLSIGPGRQMTVHLDLAAPAVRTTPDGRCVYERKRAFRHLLIDVLPLLLPGRRPPKPQRAAARRAPPRLPGAWEPVLRLALPATALFTTLILRRHSTARRTLR